MDITNVLFTRRTGKPIPSAKLPDIVFGLKLHERDYGGEEKTIDFAPIISVSDALAKPAIDLQCGIVAVQSGTGDPSPTNIRPITGFTGLSLFRGSNVSVENKEIVISAVQSGEGDPSPTNIRPISAGLTLEMDDSSTLTVWGANLNPVTGKMTITHTEVNISDLSWSLRSDGAYRATVDDLKVGGALSEKALCSNLLIKPNAYGTSYQDDVNILWQYVNTNYLYIRVNDLSDLTGGKLVYELATPQEITLSGSELARALTALGITEIPVTWQTEAGTVYGGVVDLTTGLLTVTHAIYNIIESTGLGTFTQSAQYGSWAQVANITGQKTDNNKVLCISDMAVGVSYNDRIASPNKQRVYSDGLTNKIVIRASASDNITTENDLRALFLGANIVYELATPLELPLTPQTVALLAGNNTLWCNTGDTALTYLAKKS